MPSIAGGKIEFYRPPAGGTQAAKNSGSHLSGSPEPALWVPLHFLLQENRKEEARPTDKA